MADITWQRSERPDGHRSLWFNTPTRWRHIVDSTHENSYPCVLWNGGADTPDEALPSACHNRGCPTPTAEDLAWLRGEG